MRSAARTAWHLEMRDSYMRADPAFVAWQGGEAIVARNRWPAWFDELHDAVSRGISIRRARIISEPVSDYVRFEHEITDGLNLAAGEDVRWLPRRQATDLALPGNDFWLFDSRIVMVNHFSGDGESTGYDTTDDVGLAALCASAFESVWARAIPHAAYRPN